MRESKGRAQNLTATTDDGRRRKSRERRTTQQGTRNEESKRTVKICGLNLMTVPYAAAQRAASVPVVSVKRVGMSPVRGVSAFFKVG